ncbi:conserved hypothetical protein [Bosea sp. 62]|uniref:DUF72 domain-containing protein n=1 Tax=unclassified Bosea (in: a-proteobacteria) TaxID=2653178 RepID=UPI00125C56AD|nr:MULTISPECIES: DUF72 domain-containing protein [unclassified Bosea (in: a-proteobacteria)]CAD5259595.1 conserved hypothetical protein [Bosea sp. 7B]CAD5272619.1 conserved hypothetical protein [Bosea sp. 21B]CAD5274892.1 conserved hypothetical protein [Bosea sp. 46]VVT59236.1 conserved hypothetical protein [Bosea sp. EC-HK365B]VXC24403.1 conserved hypothetical protein [Bosea sp. 127]
MATRTAGQIHIGIGGWVFEPWRGTFYPDKLSQKRELEYAASKLTSIEVNGTYYGSQKPESFAKWRAETPDGFVFALKGSRFCTNRRVLAEAGPSVEKFVTSGLSELKEKLGPINWQFMATKAFDPVDFEAFLKLLPKEVDGIRLRHAVEVRHPSFRSPDFVALLREYGVAAITAGDSDFPQVADVTAPFVYARIMGTKEAEALGYPAKQLDAWAGRAKDWAKGGAPDDLELVAPAAEKTPRDVFLYVISGDKVRNPAAAMALIERVRG